MTQSTKIKLKRLSKKLGITEKIVIDRAVSLLLQKVRSTEDFRKELNDWDALSDEAWLKIKD